MIDTIYLNMKEIGYTPEVKQMDQIVGVLEDDLLTVQERKYFLGKLFLLSKANVKQEKEEKETAKWICQTYAITKTNLNQYEKYAMGIDAIADIIPEFKSLILRSSEEVSEKVIFGMTELSPYRRKELNKHIQRKKLLLPVRIGGIEAENNQEEILVLQFES